MGIDELWVPAAELDDFNKDLLGDIRVVDVFFGGGFEMPRDAKLMEVLKKFI